MQVLIAVLMLIATRVQVKPVPTYATATPVHVHYYPEMIVFGTHSGNVGVTLDGDTTQLCSVLHYPEVPYECHDSIPKPTYKEIK